MDAFLQRCFYHAGQYDSEKSFGELDVKLKVEEVSTCLPLAVSNGSGFDCNEKAMERMGEQRQEGGHTPILLSEGFKVSF